MECTPVRSVSSRRRFHSAYLMTRNVRRFLMRDGSLNHPELTWASGRSAQYRAPNTAVRPLSIPTLLTDGFVSGAYTTLRLHCYQISRCLAKRRFMASIRSWRLGRPFYRHDSTRSPSSATTTKASVQIGNSRLSRHRERCCKYRSLVPIKSEAAQCNYDSCCFGVYHNKKWDSTRTFKLACPFMA